MSAMEKLWRAQIEGKPLSGPAMLNGGAEEKFTFGCRESNGCAGGFQGALVQRTVKSVWAAFVEIFVVGETN